MSNLHTGKVVKARTITVYPRDFPFRTKMLKTMSDSSAGEGQSMAVGEELKAPKD